MTVFETDLEKAEALDFSRPLDVHKWSDYPEVNAAVNAIYTDLYGVTDFALGHFAKDKEIVRSSAAIILREWEALTMYDQYRWQYLFDEGLIDQAYADKLANSIWDEYGEPREKRKGVPYPTETATRRIASGKGPKVSQTVSAVSDNLIQLHS